METTKKNELFCQIVEVIETLPLNGEFDKYQPILDKHCNTKSNLSKKISNIEDPFERFVVAIDFLDNLNRVNDINEEDLANIRSNHNNLLRTIMHLNKFKSKQYQNKDAELKKAKDHFDTYITNFI